MNWRACSKCGKEFPGARSGLCPACQVEDAAASLVASTETAVPADHAGNDECARAEAVSTLDGNGVAPFRPRNVFESIRQVGHDEDFEPATSEEFVPTDARPGSSQKLEMLAERVRRGLPLWHRGDLEGMAVKVTPKQRKKRLV